MIRMIILVSLLQCVAPGFQFYIKVNTSMDSNSLPKFWRSTGFSPPQSDTRSVKDYLQSKDVRMNLAIISSIPRNGIEFIRVHWLLSLLSTKKAGAINWQDLDDFIEMITQNGLKPVIELMGNSTLLYSDRKHIRSFWKSLVSSLVFRYLDKYGKKEILQWKFETWNEPDLAMYNALNYSLDEYLAYVDGCVEGIKSILPELEVGGPAGLFKNIEKHPLCWGFLDHCNKLESRCNLKYISFHKKGNGSSSAILNETMEVIEMLKRDYKNLSHLDLVNDESDILTGWWKYEDWRGDARYAAAIVRTIASFKEHVKSGSIARISFDNGFLNEPPIFFSQRTLLARFATTCGYTTFIQKPVYATMGLLSILGEEEVPINSNADQRFSSIASVTKNKSTNEVVTVNLLIGISSDDMKINSSKIDLKIKFLLPESWKNNARYALYMLDLDLPHPRKIWEEVGKPTTLTKYAAAALRNAQEPHRILQGVVRKKKFKLIQPLLQPSVLSLLICSPNVGKPGKVTNLKALNISYNDVLLTWKEQPINGRCIKTFIVEHNPKFSDFFHRINEMDIIFNSFNFIYRQSSTFPRGSENEEYTLGIYRVAAMDLWGRKGIYSDEIKYGI